MNLQFTLTEDDFIHFNLYHIHESSSTSRTLKIQRFSVPIIYMIFSFVFSKIADIPYVFMFVPFFLVSMIWVFLYPKYIKRRVVRRLRKALREGKNEGLFGEHQFTLTEEGIVDTTSTGVMNRKWSGIIKLKEDSSYFYLYTTSIGAYIIPKRDLINVDEFRNYVLANIS